MRRSTRSVKSKPTIREPSEAASLSEEGESLNGSVDDYDQETSEDEWRPDDRKRKGKRGKGGGGAVVDESDEESEGEEPFMTDDEDVVTRTQVTAAAAPAPSASSSSISIPRKKKKIKLTSIRGQNPKLPSKQPPPRVPSEEIDEDLLAAEATYEAEEQEMARLEAAEMWKQVRERKKAGKNNVTEKDKISVPTNNGKEPASLTSWLGIPEPEWPTTCEDAMINDRDSLFVGFVYSLITPSLSTISQLLSHLSKSVHPKAVPTNRLPPGMQHLASNRRGANHDMHAWRCLALKVGRTGLNGPEDFGLEEGQEDDGERFGAKEIAKVIKQLGATDVLVVVSRWYGGTMLGPVRFQHIENCARAALSRYLINEALLPMKKQLQELDNQMASLRSKLSGSSAVAAVKGDYNDLDPEKAERLIMARKRAIDMLQKRINSSSQSAAELAIVNEVEKAATAEPDQGKEQNPPTPAPLVPETLAEKTAVKEEDVDDGVLTGWDELQ